MYLADVYDDVLDLPLHVSNFSTKITGFSAQITSLPLQPSVPRNSDFVGYEDILARLDRAFSDAEPQRWVKLSGPGGAG